MARLGAARAFQCESRMPQDTALTSARDVRRVPFLLRISLRRRQDTPRGKSGHCILFFYSPDGRPQMDIRARCAPRPIPATYFASSASRQAMWSGKTFCIVFSIRLGEPVRTSARDVRRVPFLPRISQRRRQDRPCGEEKRRLCIDIFQSGWEGPD